MEKNVTSKDTFHVYALNLKSLIFLQWCTMADHNEFWCATELDRAGQMVHWGLCRPDCPGVEDGWPTCLTLSQKVRKYY